MDSALILLRDAGLTAAILGIGWLLLVEVVLRGRMDSAVHHWSLLVGILVLPAIAALSTMAITVDQTKTVQFCGSCHVMQPFLDDMFDPNSDSLAARHHVNKWIPRDPCYWCHTTYGLHGALLAKVGGFRHWVSYVSGRWEGQIRYRGRYPNANCLMCHDATPNYDRIGIHRKRRTDLVADRLPCFECHGPPHAGTSSSGNGT